MSGICEVAAEGKKREKKISFLPSATREKRGSSLGIGAFWKKKGEKRAPDVIFLIRREGGGGALISNSTEEGGERSLFHLSYGKGRRKDVSFQKEELPKPGFP